jgi:hypothetical protein
MTRRVVSSVVLALACLVFLPAVARAQSAITGAVKDTSGAVLPGVTVEAASDVLIEKVKSVVTDGNGVYRINDLRPGVYSVTFSLPGFQTFRRDGLQLPAEFTMSIDADMKVGSLEETITVSGDAPVVDVSTAVHTQVLNREAIDAIPTGRTIQGLGQLVVGVSLSLPDTGGARAMQQTYMSTHGLSAANNTVMVDGMIVNGLQADGAVQSYFNDAMNQEVSYQTSGINAETSSGGVRLNMIPREGGNTFSGTFGTAYRPGDWQSNNVTARHQALGVVTGTSTDRIIDFTGTEGGPIKKDKLWFFGSGRYFSVNNFISGTLKNDGSQGVDDQFIKSGLVRLTWQITPKLKFGAYHDEIDKFRGHDMQSGWDYEEAAGIWHSPAYHTNQGKLTYTATSRLLFEGGFSSNLEYYTNQPQEGLDKLRGTADWFTSIAKYDRTAIQAAGNMLLTCASITTCTPNTTQSPARYNWQASSSYVTGSHNIKGGVQYQRGTFYHSQKTNGDLQEIFASPVGAAFTRPEQVIVLNTSGQQYGERLNYDFAIYGQDSWTMKRLTVNLGLRWEALESSVIGGTQPANRFVPQVEFPEINGLPKWKNIAPRFSSVYDLFGNSKTALKYSVNRYNISRTTGIAETYNGQQLRRVALPWNDANNDGVAQGQIDFPNGVRTPCVFNTPGCEINFANLPTNYGLKSENTFGNYKRAYDIEHAVELQHELFPRLSLTGSWFHGSFGNLSSTINENLRFNGDPTQNPFYRPYTVYNPLTGEPITAYAKCPATATQAANQGGNPCGTTLATATTNNIDFTDNSDLRKLSYNAYNLEFRARIGRGAQLFGGLAFERQLVTDCARAADDPNKLRFCDDSQNDIPFARQFKLAGNYPLPYGVQFSASFQSTPGPTGVGTPSQGVPSSPANPSATRTMVFTPGSTRYPSTCPAPCPAGQIIAPANLFFQTSQTIYLQPPDATFIERLNQLDIKVARTFKYNRVTFIPQLEIFNLLNADDVVTYVTTNTLATTYLRPNSLLQPRLIGVGAQVKW